MLQPSGATGIEAIAAGSSTANPIQIENAKPGTASWRITSRAGGDISGFASKTSIAAGSSLTIYVQTNALSFDAFVYRMGWYHGAGARLLDTIGLIPGDPQRPCTAPPPMLTIECPWRESAVIPTRPTWVTGVYLVKLVASDGAESYIPFTLRESKAYAPILFQSSTTTWQAYNLWGGNSLYRALRSFDGRPADDSYARAVSFDRPYAWPGDGQLFRFELPLLTFLEQHGYDVAYATDNDLDLGTSGITKRRVIISAGHDEYYSSNMRSALESALARGTSLAFLGADDIQRHIRFASPGTGLDRIVIHYKDLEEDPHAGDPVLSTADWRAPPINRPEERLIGAEYAVCSARYATWRPWAQPSWLFAGTGLQRGSGVSAIVGYEQDLSWRNLRPRGLVIVAHQTFRCSQRYRAGTSASSDSTFYIAPSGAGVFDAGTLWFACALGPGCGHLPMAIDPVIGSPPVRAADRRVELLVRNLLHAMQERRFG